MIVRDLGTRRTPGLLRAAAEVTWEISEREPFELFVECSDEFTESLQTDRDAYLLACLLPAWRDGEKRVRVEELAGQLTITPRLRA